MTRLPDSLTEAVFQRHTTELATLTGWRWMHVRRSVRGETGGWTTATTEPGWPDLVLWRPGQLLFRELKSDTGKLTEPQRDLLLSLRAAGADVEVWRPSDWPLIETKLRCNT